MGNVYTFFRKPNRFVNPQGVDNVRPWDNCFGTIYINICNKKKGVANMSFYEKIKFLNKIIDKGEIAYSPCGIDIARAKTYNNAKHELKVAWIKKEIPYNSIVDFMELLHEMYINHLF